MSKHLLMSYSIKVERRAPIHDDQDIQYAIHDVIGGSGLLNGGAHGVDPASIRFEVVDD